MNQDTKNDLLLINSVQLGDKKAFDSLIGKYQNKVLRIINRYIKDLDESFDLGQEIFIKVYNSIGNFRKECSFFTWLYKITINTTKSYLIDKNKHYPNYSFDIMLDENWPIGKGSITEHNTPDQLLLCAELKDVFLSVTETLPEELKMTIYLREVNECTYEEIAYIMECPVGTVRSRIFRAREAISKNISRSDNYH